MAKRKKKDERGFWTVDAETDPFKEWETVEEQRIPKPFIWGLYTGASVHTFNTVDDVFNTIKDQEVICFAHNGGKFDFHLNDGTSRLLDHINHFEDVKIINGRLVSAMIGKCEIRDSWNLLPAPLREFGSKLEIDYAKLEADVRHLHMPEIKSYLAQDVIGLWQAIEGFERKYGRHLTQAGAAMAQWEEISGQKAPRTDKPFFHKFSPYYYGGRVQVFQRGYIKGPKQVYDIRSAYPRAMLDDHPYSPIYVEHAYPKTVLGADMVTIDCVSNGALPFRNAGGSITFPRDNERRRFQCTGWEVNAALDTGALRQVEIINAVRFANLQNFTKYIMKFYNLRKHYRDVEKDVAQSFFAKTLMVSLYGKYGANPENYGNFMLVPWDRKLDHDQEGYEFNGRLGMHAVLRGDLDPWQEHYINVATAASITGWVRAYLWRALDLAHDPIYCDTDCIMATSVAGIELGQELGQWNHEGTFTEGWFAGKKLYYLKGSFEKGKKEKMASKGVRPDPKKIKAAALGHSVKVRSAAPTFSLKDKRGVYFQERTIRSTGTVD